MVCEVVFDVMYDVVLDVILDTVFDVMQTHNAMIMIMYGNVMCVCDTMLPLI